ncbi:MAG: M56 family metallopeptidase [Pseudomonadota bacterium]
MVPDLIDQLTHTMLPPQQLLELFIKGGIICWLGIWVCRDLSLFSAAARHRVAMVTVYSMALLIFVDALVPAYRVPVLPALTWETADPMASLWTMAVVLYIGVSLALFTRLATDCYQVLAITSRSRRVADLIPKRVAGCLDVSATDVLLSEDVESPVTWGWRRPVILLPVEFMHWHQDDRETALLHEAAHIERADWATHMLARLVHCLYWPLPGFASLLRELSLSAEQACDDRLIMSGVPAAEYATSLLRHARNQRLPAGIYFVRESELAQRIRHLIAERVDRSHSDQETVVLSVLCVSIAMLVALMQPVPRAEPVGPNWGAMEPPPVSAEAGEEPAPSLRFASAFLESLEPGPARPPPPPAVPGPPRSAPLTKPTIPPPN